MPEYRVNHDEVMQTLAWADENKNNQRLIHDLMHKAAERKGLSYREASLLLAGAGSDELFGLAGEIKQEFYGNRVVLFAPLYLSNYCVNGCVYCPYNHGNVNMPRRKLTQDEIRREVIALQEMGHKRIAIEAGEHPEHNPLEYILESIKTIYDTCHKNGAIRRINVNIAATCADDYRRLKDAGIGTYLLFQETYHEPTYRALHPSGPKGDYDYHVSAMDRAMQGGIDDVGLGVLFGLADYMYEFTALLLHAEHLEQKYGVGPHTVSVPRIRPADNVNLDNFTHGIDDETFARIVACLRISTPYTGIIVSTRESEASRRKILDIGVSQISGGSRTGVGDYCSSDNRDTRQFRIDDDRSLDDIVRWLLQSGYIPSFCTACYREGRTGDRFMKLCKSGEIRNVCHPNSLLTLQEYLLDYASPETRRVGEALIAGETKSEAVQKRLNDIMKGDRDFRI